MITKPDRNVLRKKRHYRIRKKLFGNAHRPRLSVYRSTKHIYAQIIDDMQGMTLVHASTLDKELRDQLNEIGTGNKEAAALVGELLARRAKAKGIEKIVFDRGGYKYHGRVQALAEAARAGGLDF
ncbi:MAG: LSU ribosomal protein L18p (L5e) [Candidatus Carbobacillus altaicus]|uniref:Large ribosomal subunit protein uL18 n=1 Tax=Candidatus Carbonibacillus altaicus TaxID=2163959 RepID=A0A2R6Y2T4_9BACL|nr:MAG: LSU ribosomal protein L18p (L5e) [Candidatus Carbobacillus altaicus]